MIQLPRRGREAVAASARPDILAAREPASPGWPSADQPVARVAAASEPASRLRCGRARRLAVVAAVGLTAGGLAGCGQHHPPKPTNLTCAANYSVQWSGKHDRWECQPNKSSSNDGNSGSRSSRRGTRRH